MITYFKTRNLHLKSASKRHSVFDFVWIENEVHGRAFCRVSFDDGEARFLKRAEYRGHSDASCLARVV